MARAKVRTRRLPAFLLGRNPECRIAIVSYNTTKARKFNRELQRILQEESYQQLFPQTFLAGGAPHGMRSNHRAYARNADECEIVGHRGSFKTLGVGGALTGEPVDVLIMDESLQGCPQRVVAYHPSKYSRLVRYGSHYALAQQ